MAKFIHCRVDGTGLPLAVALTLFYNALSARSPELTFHLNPAGRHAFSAIREAGG